MTLRPVVRSLPRDPHKERFDDRMDCRVKLMPTRQ
jgi:hypothetical protein